MEVRPAIILQSMFSRGSLHLWHIKVVITWSVSLGIKHMIPKEHSPLILCGKLVWQPRIGPKLQRKVTLM